MLLCRFQPTQREHRGGRRRLQPAPVASDEARRPDGSRRDELAGPHTAVPTAHPCPPSRHRPRQHDLNPGRHLLGLGARERAQTDQRGPAQAARACRRSWDRWPAARPCCSSSGAAAPCLAPGVSRPPSEAPWPSSKAPPPIIIERAAQDLGEAWMEWWSWSRGRGGGLSSRGARRASDRGISLLGSFLKAY